MKLYSWKTRASCGQPTSDLHFQFEFHITVLRYIGRVSGKQFVTNCNIKNMRFFLCTVYLSPYPPSLVTLPQLPLPYPPLLVTLPQLPLPLPPFTSHPPPTTSSLPPFTSHPPPTTSSLPPFTSHPPPTTSPPTPLYLSPSPNYRPFLIGPNSVHEQLCLLEMFKLGVWFLIDVFDLGEQLCSRPMGRRSDVRNVGSAGYGSKLLIG